ncbi:MAG: GDSL-type esterase/lipase family protein [Myxococcota bacterium]
MRAIAKSIVRPWTVTLAAPLLLYFVSDAFVRFDLRRQGWFDTWEYMRRADAAVGYGLRGGVSNRLDGAETHTNEDGFRARTPSGHFAPKAAGEILIATLGDSNTFGAGIEYEQTFPVLLERHLKTRLQKPVRVVNLGVLGYSLVQSAEILRRWAALAPDALVVTVNSHNDRVFVGRPDSARAFAHDAQALPYEFGDFISYPILYWYRKSLRQKLARQTAPAFEARIPLPRVAKQDYPALMAQVAKFATSRSMKVVFLTTLESSDSPEAEAGIAALRRSDPAAALEAFTRAQLAHGPQFPSAYWAYRAALELGRDADAREIRARYVQSYARYSDTYLLNFSYYGGEYAELVREAAKQLNAPLVDLHQTFETAGVRFYHGHYDSKGHALVAEALTPVLAELLTTRASAAR